MSTPTLDLLVTLRRYLAHMAAQGRQVKQITITRAQYTQIQHRYGNPTPAYTLDGIPFNLVET